MSLANLTTSGWVWLFVTIAQTFGTIAWIAKPTRDLSIAPPVLFTAFCWVWLLWLMTP